MSDDKPTPFDLNKHTARLLMREPFFAGLSRRIDKTPTTEIPTAGVRINPERAQFELMYNPDFMASLSDKHRLAILKHEFYHIIYEHVTGRLPPEGMNMMWNIATAFGFSSTSPVEISYSQTQNIAAATMQFQNQSLFFVILAL